MKKFLIPIGVLVVAATVAIALNYQKLENLITHKNARNENLITPEKVADNIYKLDYKGDYKLDDYLKAGINNLDDYDKWFMDNLTFGASLNSGDPNVGCSSFSVIDENGNHLFARNYDMVKDDALLIRTTPKDGYKSIGIADIGKAGIGEGQKLKIEDKDSKKILNAAPYLMTDGVNEKGLGVSVLTLPEDFKLTDTDKPDLIIFSATRMILDKCANVDEAVEMLKDYDIYCPGHHWYHLFITDKSGKSVITEWMDDEFYVVEDDVVTNFVLHDDKHSKDSDGRVARIRYALEGKDTVSKSEAMEVLSKARMSTCKTCWSVVYDLDNFLFDVCFYEDYNKKYSYSEKNFN